VSSVEFRHLDIIHGSTAGNAVGNRFGGGILVGASASLRMTHCAVRDCAALTDGGGVRVNAGALLLASDCTFSGNAPTTAGGGLSSGGIVVLERVTFSDNTAVTNGGAIANTQIATLTNCTLSGNRANGHGGAIDHTAAAADTLSLTHCTLTANRANDDSAGGGVGGGVRVFSGIAQVRNTIISGNDALVGLQDDIGGAFTSLGNNLLGTATGGAGFTAGVNGDLVGAATVLGPLSSNGGTTQTHALGAGSAAVDAAAAVTLLTDQRGLARAIGAPDIGAYELQAETYTYWAAYTFPAGTDSSAAADADGDRIANGIEYAAGTDPLDATSQPVLTPAVQGGNFIVAFPVSPRRALNFARIALSPDLQTWTPAALLAYLPAGIAPDGVNRLLRVIVPTGGPRQFARWELAP
jgi:predicted outer membrane repeat protein